MLSHVKIRMKGSCEALVLKEANSRNQMSRLNNSMPVPFDEICSYGRRFETY